MPCGEEGAMPLVFYVRTLWMIHTTHGSYSHIFTDGENFKFQDTSFKADSYLQIAKQQQQQQIHSFVTDGYSLRIKKSSVKI